MTRHLFSYTFKAQLVEDFLSFVHTMSPEISANSLAKEFLKMQGNSQVSLRSLRRWVGAPVFPVESHPRPSYRLADNGDVLMTSPSDGDVIISARYAHALDLTHIRALTDETASDETASDESVQDESVQDETASDETASDEGVQDETASDESVQDETASDESVQDETASDESVQDETASDESVQDETAVNTHTAREDNAALDRMEELLTSLTKDLQTFTTEVNNGVTRFERSAEKYVTKAEKLQGQRRAANPLQPYFLDDKSHDPVHREMTSTQIPRKPRSFEVTKDLVYTFNTPDDISREIKDMMGQFRDYTQNIFKVLSGFERNVSDAYFMRWTLRILHLVEEMHAFLGKFAIPRIAVFSYLVGTRLPLLAQNAAMSERDMFDMINGHTYKEMPIIEAAQRLQASSNRAAG